MDENYIVKHSPQTFKHVSTKVEGERALQHPIHHPRSVHHPVDIDEGRLSFNQMIVCHTDAGNKSCSNLVHYLWPSWKLFMLIQETFLILYEFTDLIYAYIQKDYYLGLSIKCKKQTMCFKNFKAGMYVHFLNLNCQTSRHKQYSRFKYTHHRLVWGSYQIRVSYPVRMKDSVQLFNVCTSII